MIKMVIFDMAGTTINENNLVYKCVQQAINENGLNIGLNEVLSVGAGKEKFDAIRAALSLYGVHDEKLARTIFQRFLILLEASYSTNEITECEGAGSLFLELKKREILVVLNTGYDRKTAESLLTKIGWKEGVDIDMLITASDVDKARPHPDMILLAMKKAGIEDAKQVVKIGDSMIDIEEGKNAGCFWSIGISTGAHDHAQLQSASPDFIIDKLAELLPILDQSQHSSTLAEMAIKKPL